MIKMNRLKELRKEKKLYQKDIAKELFMSQTGYSQYETETNDISTLMLKRIANFYNVSIDYILCLTDDRTPYTKSIVNNIDSNNNRLKDIREDKDLNQTKLAKILEMSQTGYSAYETKDNDIPTRILIKLANYYNVPIDYLLYITDNRIPHKRK